MRDRLLIVETFEALCAAGEPGALATVVGVEGSSYRHPGARMLIAADGRTWGTISGGCLERDVARRGRMLIPEAAKPIVVSYETDEDEIGEESARPIVDPGPSLGCGGRIDILIQRVTADEPGSLGALGVVVRERKRAAVATVVRTGSAADDSVFAGTALTRVADEPIRGNIDDRALREAISHQLTQTPPTHRLFRLYRNSLSRGGWADVLVEWLVPSQSLAIFGDGHDVAPLVDLAKALGWHVTVVGSRAVAGLRQSFPNADELICATDNLALAAGQIPTAAAAVIMGHNFRRDSAFLSALVQRDRGYTGVLGPRRRTARLLGAAGLRGDETRVHAPVGLDIGAESSEQVALAIVAEIQANAADRPGGSLRDRNGPIHLDREEEIGHRLKSDSHS
jgi:xanthine/CO dehydrogenase XdhC/CoxF family maturation factor